MSATEQQILRYTASGNTGGSFITLKSGLPTRGLNHDGGAIGVGPDGKLYWAIGDNGNGTGVDADLTLLAAKISRSNRDGTLPADNPFNDGAGPNNDFIWGRGYRNPFTMTFQPGTGKLWMNVVGTGYEQVFIATVPSTTTFTAAQSDTNASSGGGTATTLNQGGCITGGAFWDSSAAPAAYRGNFFYGDFNSGRVMRTILDGSNEVSSVDYFSGSSHIPGCVDTSIGPDGAIYSASENTPVIRRAAFNASSQGLVVTPTFLQTDEAGRTAFSVRLATAPVANTVVSIARTSGDSDLTVFAGATLTFTPLNFATPQMVTIAAAEDGDASADSATISVQGGGFVTQTVSVSVTDNEAAAPVFTSTPVTTAVVNAPYSYQAAATGPPAPAFSLVSPPVGMTVGSSSGLVSWTPAATGTFNITLRANNGIPPIAQQAFAINVVPDNPPVAVMTRPYAGAIVSGTNAEWFGNGIDDVGCVQARFYVDNALVYTDINTGNHYHFGGAHSLWNTTTLSDGGHQLKIVVTDTAAIQAAPNAV